jgi:hypothetical protein
MGGDAPLDPWNLLTGQIAESIETGKPAVNCALRNALFTSVVARGSV